MNAQPHDAEELESVLKRTMKALLERVPDGYGRILRAVSEITNDPAIDELAALAYREEQEEAAADRLAHGKPAPGVH